MKILKVAPTKYRADLINAVGELIDGRLYDLGAIVGRYSAAGDVFYMTNSFVARRDTIYSNRVA